MSWSNAQKAAVAMAVKSLSWQRPQYELLLRNIAGVRPWLGKISSKNPGNTDEGFARFMAYAERSGYVDPKHGPGHWIAQAQLQCTRMHHKIAALACAGAESGILQDAPSALAAFIERQTQQRPGGPTRLLEECDFEWSFKVLEGLKAWLWRESKKQGIKLEL